MVGIFKKFIPYNLKRLNPGSEPGFFLSKLLF